MNTDRKYMEDHRGNLVPVENISPADLLRDELVKQIVAKATDLNDKLTRFKEQSMDDIATFCQQVALDYGVNYGGKKGNIQLTSFDGSYRVQKSINEYIVFDERLQIAKTLIDECIHDWMADMEGQMFANIKSLINQAFEVDKQGKISTDRILSLRRISITDPKWLRAMDALSDSIQITGSKEYIRVYKRGSNGSYEQITLDLSSILCGNLK